MLFENFTTGPRSLLHLVLTFGALQLILHLSLTRGLLFGVAHGDARWVGGIARL